MPADRCEPPEEARGERWPWDDRPPSSKWIMGHGLAEEVCDDRWLAVAKPPEGV